MRFRCAGVGIGTGGPTTVILEAIIGSHAYGLATASSDVDRRGVFVAPTEAFWLLEKPPTSVEGPDPEQLGWEVEHFCRDRKSTRLNSSHSSISYAVVC